MIQEDISSIRAENIYQIYGKRTVVDSVSIEVSRGSIVGLIGPNGSGKTSTFYIITGIAKPSKGRVYMNNKDITDLPLHARSKLGLGYLPQESVIFKGMSTIDNINAVLEMFHKDKKIIKSEADRLIDKFSLGHVAYSLAESLSGGQKRRLEIARAIACKPKFLLFDEPFAGVDPIAILDIKELVLEIATKENVGILITDHNVLEMLDMATKIYAMYNGQILTCGTPDEIINHSKVKEVYLGHYSKAI